MGFLQSYGFFLVKHPARVLILGVTMVVAALLVTLLIRPIPTFNDPLSGFEVRDTLISTRINAWKLLTEEITASANNLSLTTNSAKYEESYLSSLISQRYQNELNLPDFLNNNNKLADPPVIEMSTQNVGQNATLNVDTLLDEDEDEYYKSINSTQDPSQTLMHFSLGSNKAFCGKLYEGYAQVVVSTSLRYSSLGLFNLNSMLAVCQLDKRLRLENFEESAVFQKDCEKFSLEKEEQARVGQTATCCNSWSLPNYIACLNNKTSCMEIDINDLKTTEQLLHLCAPHYYRAPYEECFIDDDLQKDKGSKSTETFANFSSSPLNILSSTAHRFAQFTSQTHCGTIPDGCLKCNGWTFTVLNYLTSERFTLNKLNQGPVPTPGAIGARRVRPNPQPEHRINTARKGSLVNRLSYTNIFLPIAKSSSLMRYYQTIAQHNLRTPYAQVKAMDLGLKNSLFEHLISDDIRLFVIALISILVIISVYTWSFILSLVILMIICLSLCLSFTIYELILNVPLFPFMNLLGVVISFGICSDNAMLFCKYWTLTENCEIEPSSQANENAQVSQQHKYNLNELHYLDRMLKRAFVSTLMATLATACSFIISAISKVIAVRCFCIFATLSVITNYLLIVLLLPPALILDSRLANQINKFLISKGSKVALIVRKADLIRTSLLKAGAIFHKNWIFHAVTRYKLYLIITFLTLLSCSSILVFHKPTLQLADDDDIQLFSSKHTFEQYNKNLRRQFAFERAKLGESPSGSVTTNNPVMNQFHEVAETLPIRVVFGVLPVDNGNHLDPLDRGTLVFDPKFNLSDPTVQVWLLDFCHKLKQQRFIHPSSAPDLMNCFIDTFKSWMDTRSCKDPIQPDLDRSPCCQAYEFPYSSYILDKCLGEAVSIMRKTPQFNPNLSAGVRFFKNSTKVAAVIIEYQSNRLFSESFTKMEAFFNDVDEWISWKINNTAPAGLKSGWFVSSNLELLALQTELEQSTMNSILLEVVFAMLALMIGTRDLVLTIAGTVTIGTIIIVMVAALIILKWTLGVAESILISLTIGLSIDFALHYSVAYCEIGGIRSSHGVISRILDEVGSPIALATITTSLSGFVIFWSDILAYQELGVFLMLIAVTSWTTSTFFLVPMLATVSSVFNNGEFFARLMLQRALKVLIDRL